MIRPAAPILANLLVTVFLTHPAGAQEATPSDIQPSAPPTAAATPASSAIQRTTLDNGMTVVLQPMPGADKVAVIALYGVGFIDEPKGLPQSSHLLEHLRIFCSTASYAAGESWSVIQSKGLAGAETMPDFSHFDFVLPAADLDVALKIEAERLSSLHILPEVIREQAPAVRDELNQVQQHPQGPFFKYAAIAANQAWRNPDVQEVLFHQPLDNTSIADLEKLRAEHYSPDNLTLVVAGGFQVADALEAVKRFLGVLPPAPAVPSPPIDYAALPKDRTVRWDVTGDGLVVAFPPPADPIDRLIMTMWGDFLYPRFYQDDAINVPTRCIFCSNLQWPVGVGGAGLPFLVYATAMEGFTLDQAQKVVLERLDAIADQLPSDAEMENLRRLSSRLAEPAPTTWEQIQQQAANTGANPDQARLAVLGNLALKSGINDLATRGQATAAAARLTSMSPADMQALIKRTLDPATRSIIRLEPLKPKQPPETPAADR
jgi:predicted Zn-dependent peptidase